MGSSRRLRLLGLALALSAAGALRARAASAPEKPLIVPLQAGDGIGFDDVIFAPRLRRVLVPGGKTGKLFLIDPDTRRVSEIPGFSSAPGLYQGGHGDGATSADEAGDVLLAVDRTTRKLSVVDPAQGRIVASAALEAGPDYVRWVAPTRQAWVSEPGREQLEVFSLADDAGHALTRVGRIAVHDGPESLLVDAGRHRAFTHTWHGTTHEIDLATRAIVASFANGCRGSRGIALDAQRGFLFAGCAEGKATVLDVDHGGKLLGSARTGSGVDIIAYGPKLQHLYVPAADDATLSVLAVASSGALSTLAAWPSAAAGHCAVADDHERVWVCDPTRGRVLSFKDETRGRTAP